MLPPSESFLNFAEHLADCASNVTRKYFRHLTNFDRKNDNSPVSIADRETEKLLRAKIAQQYPEHAIFGEEEGKSGDALWTWVIDPIDGTKSFVSGFPIYCTLIALMYDNQPVVSVIDMPELNERFTATWDGPSKLNGREIHTLAETKINAARCFSTSPTMFDPQESACVKTLYQHSQFVHYGGDAYLYAMLAAGWIELVVEAELKPYDYLPLILIVERAGGIITDWQGRALTENSNGQVIAAANKTLHQQAIACLQEDMSFPTNHFE